MLGTQRAKRVQIVPLSRLWCCFLKTIEKTKPLQTFSVLVTIGFRFYHYLFDIVDRTTN